MKNRKLGFIGCGNMGQAILAGILKEKSLEKEEIMVSVHSENSKVKIEENYGVYVTLNNKEVASCCDVVILAIKPYQYDEVIEDIKEELQDKVIVSVAAGISMNYLQAYFPKAVKVIRVMPNTPACVNEAMTSISVNDVVDEKEEAFVTTLFLGIGHVEKIEENMIDEVIALSGSSPAYIFMILDAMIKHGIKNGMSKEKAFHFVSQAVLGAAKMVLETKQDPDILKKNVCSPNGTTIEAVHVLEEQGLYQMMEKAMDACYERSIEMTK